MFYEKKKKQNIIFVKKKNKLLYLKERFYNNYNPLEWFYNYKSF